MTTGAQLRNQGITDVLAADVSVTRDFASLIREAVDAIGGDLTSDDVRAWIEATYPGVEPHSPNVIGGTLQRMAEARRLRPVGYRPSSRPEARHRPIRVWRT